ncbi:[FeFe] hydrogenase, group A [Desulforudis sp. DRI-14]|uniref:[FeFe] hydrogenase, group A n=1 Tax=Desulforudis sp. DRI-14 TaxID=3459793 RepID=UPI004042456A
MSEDLFAKEETRKELTRRSFLKLMTGLGLTGLAGVTLRGLGLGGLVAPAGGLVAPAVGYASKLAPADVVPIAPDNPSIVYYQKFCLRGSCDACVRVCNEVQTVLGFWDEKVAQEIVCVNCGQCALVCPGKDGLPAIRERDETAVVFDALASPDYHVVVQTAPATRVALGEEFGLAPGTWVEGQQVAALRRLGFDAVFNTNFTADLTIMEEATEFLQRVVNGTHPLPMFTSCSPGWVKFMEYFYPALIPHVSTCMSPQQMFGALAKTYYAKARGLNPEKIISVSIMPCTAKKFEAQRPEMNAASRYWNNSLVSRDVDVVLTTRELARMIKARGIDFANLPVEGYDSLMGEDTGAAIIFGATGGVMEAALRTAYFFLTGAQPPQDLLNFTPVRGLVGIKEASVQINGVTVNVAVAHELKNARTVCDMVLAGNPNGWHFIEFMSCSGGCISGGGQPRTAVPPTDPIRQARIDALYVKDAAEIQRASYENSEVLALYQNFLGEPYSKLAKQLLHTTYVNRGPVV